MISERICLIVVARRLRKLTKLVESNIHNPVTAHQRDMLLSQLSVLTHLIEDPDSAKGPTLTPLPKFDRPRLEVV